GSWTLSIASAWSRVTRSTSAGRASWRFPGEIASATSSSTSPLASRTRSRASRPAAPSRVRHPSRQAESPAEAAPCASPEPAASRVVARALGPGGLLDEEGGPIEPRVAGGRIERGHGELVGALLLDGQLRLEGARLARVLQREVGERLAVELHLGLQLVPAGVPQALGLGRAAAHERQVGAHGHGELLAG